MPNEWTKIATMVLVLTAATTAQEPPPPPVPAVVTPAPQALPFIDLPFPDHKSPAELFDWIKRVKLSARDALAAARQRRDAAEVSRVLARLEAARIHGYRVLHRLGARAAKLARDKKLQDKRAKEAKAKKASKKL